MNGRQEFKTRIVIEGKTYLLAEDCAHALEYGSQDEFVDDHRALIKEIPTLPPLLLDSPDPRQEPASSPAQAQGLDPRPGEYRPSVRFAEK